MIKDNIIKNQSIKPNSYEIEKLKTNFPEFFNIEGEFLFEQFKEMLHQSDITLSKEGYELKFLGKSYARYQSATKSETFISPDIAHNSLEENKDSQNIYIVGDNLDALKHLLGSYAGKIKCIYIDPPYNRGKNDFVYPDTFSFTAQELSDIIGIEIDEAERVLGLAGKSSHSAWLMFMYPRLVLARELLSEDGIIFISIDHNEQANLLLCCDEIFGEENRLTTITRATGTPTGGGFDGFTNELDYCLVYSKNIEHAVVKGLAMDEESSAIYNKIDCDGNRYLTRSLRRTGGEDRKEDRPSMFYPVVAPDGSEIYPYGPSGYESRWMYSKKSYMELESSGLIEWNLVSRNGKQTYHPYVKYYLDGRLKKAGNIWKFLDMESELWDVNVGNKKATSEIKALLGGKYFETPKPVQLLKKILSMIDGDFVVLDFFSGSGTTAQAVMELNTEDRLQGIDTQRSYILVQIPEQIDNSKSAYKAGFKTIDEIGRTRIIKAAKTIKDNVESDIDIDYGFKLYQLTTIGDKLFDKLETFEPTNLITDNMVELFKTELSSGKDAIIKTYLVMDGYGLTCTTSPYLLNDYVADKYMDSLYIIEPGLNSEDVMILIKDIESRKLDINRIVLYSYSLNFSVLHELRKNLLNLQNNKSIELIERY